MLEMPWAYAQVGEAKLGESCEGAAEIRPQLVDSVQRPVGTPGELDRERRSELDIVCVMTENRF